MLGVIIRFFASDILAKAVSVALLPVFSLLMGPAQLGKFSEWFSIFNVLAALVSIGIPSYALVVLNSPQSPGVEVLSAKFLNFFREWLRFVIPLLIVVFLVCGRLVYGLGILIAALSFSFINYIESILRFRKDVKQYLILELSISAATSFLPLLLVVINPTWEYRSLGYTVGLILLALILKGFVLSEPPKKRIDRNFKVALFKFGVPIVLILGVNWLKLALDIQLLKHFSGYASSGILFFSFQIISIINILAASLNRSSVTIFYELLGKGALRQFHWLVFKILGLLILLAVMVIIIAVMGIKFYMPAFQQSIQVLYPMTAGIVIYALGQFISAVFMFHKQTYLLTLSIFFSSLAHPFISYWMIENLGWQYIGYSYVLSSILFLVLVLMLRSIIQAPAGDLADIHH